MASFIKNTMTSEDDEDLEMLRLAALKSLKSKSINMNQEKIHENTSSKLQHSFKSSTFGAAQTTRHHNRGFRSNGSRLGRNGLCSRARTNTNLISIRTVDSEDTKDIKENSANSAEAPKLVLPQDRYHKPLVESTTKETTSNKFDRYDNSDDSESDSDELTLKPAKRERKDSLELLMDELENEINVLDAKTANGNEAKRENEEKMVCVEKVESSVDNQLSLEDCKVISTDEFKSEEVAKPVKVTRSPGEEKGVEEVQKKVEEPQKVEKRKSASPKPNYAASLKRRTISRSPEVQYRSPHRSRSPPRKIRYSPTYGRPLSPLALNTEVLNTITMAPLSPRSAAFVLENRQILARRQMSPWRSLSRESSLSPRRRSLSPRMSPKRGSASPRNYRRSPYKPKHPTAHPVTLGHKQQIYRRAAPRSSPRPSSRNSSPLIRPDLKRRRNSRSLSLSLSPSPDRSYPKRPLNETTGHLNPDRRTRDNLRKDRPKPDDKSDDRLLDPVLEARKRKFEAPMQIQNGIIKLKPSRPENKSPQLPEPQEEIRDVPKDENLIGKKKGEGEEVDDAILDLNPTLSDLWSDEESDNENEGRFKSTSTASGVKNITILPFRKLTEKPTSKDPLKTSLLPKNYKNEDRRNKPAKVVSKRRSRTPLKLQANKLGSKSADAVEKSRSKVIDSQDVKQSDGERKKEKSVVVHVKSESKPVDVLKTVQAEKNSHRKVKIQVVPDVSAGDSNTENNEEPEIIVENEDDAILNKDGDVDLRAELSRRRAQRLIKAGSLAEALPARLLKNALQEVVPKRAQIRHSKVQKGTGNSADRRVLILKSLTTSPTSQLEPAIKAVSSKEGKLPIHMRLGSNASIETSEEVVRGSERRAKRPRSNRRKKAAVQV